MTTLVAVAMLSTVLAAFVPAASAGIPTPPRCSNLVDETCPGTFCFSYQYTCVDVKEPEMQCMERYWEVNAGVVKVVSRSSCEYSVERGDGIDLIDIGTSGPGPVNCMYRYWEMTAGDVKVVSRSTCHYDVYVNGQPLLG